MNQEGQKVVPGFKQFFVESAEHTSESSMFWGDLIFCLFIYYLFIFLMLQNFDQNRRVVCTCTTFYP